MNQYVAELARIGAKEKRLIIGLMSGTSLDGLDIALCEVSGNGLDTSVQVKEFMTIPFNQEFKEVVKSVFSKRTVDLENICLLHPWIAEQHAAMILNALAQWGVNPSEVDLIASHGQTIFHAPKRLHGRKEFGNGTLQLGDGDHLAVKTGIITISDFRQKHIAAGGEGAPLAVYGDYFIFRKAGENRIMLNIGGIANFTFLPGDQDITRIFSTDTGPGNTLMDAFARFQFNRSYDENAAIARQGKVNEVYLKALKEDPFFQQDFPKTTGPELFNLKYGEKALLNANISAINHVDTMATLNRFTADTIADAIKKTLSDQETYSVYSSGGGIYNPLLMEQLRAQLPHCRFYTTSDLEINPDAKEAVLFALLANETVAGGNTFLGAGSNTIPAVTMGKISFPG